MIRFTTYTGSVYLWDEPNSRLMRTEKGDNSNPIHRDGEWERVNGKIYLQEGTSAVFALDRAGTEVFRVTSPVEVIERIA